MTDLTMRQFIATMSYELSADTPPDARKLLLAELVGRRWKDRVKERRMPRNTVWIKRGAEDHETTSDLHLRCSEELRDAAAAVARSGRVIRVLRAYVQVAGGGSYGLAPEGFFEGSPKPPDEPG
ncbi:MAG: hypothetical protein KC731_02580 [Myxococcales bacterium]|nr:hypothetical protein [Myxococcales bacterium]